MKLLLGLLLALSLCIAPGLADMEAMSANDTAGACGEESCDLNRRTDVADSLDGTPEYTTNAPPYDYYCNTKDERKACLDTGDNRWLSGAMCRAYCRCNAKADGTKGTITCNSWGSCDQKAVSESVTRGLWIC